MFFAYSPWDYYLGIRGAGKGTGDDNVRDC
jgi:hypothetical protein